MARKKRQRATAAAKQAVAVQNASLLQSRARLAGLDGKHFAGERDLYEVFGYERHLTPAAMRSEYARGDISKRIVDAYPRATWREPPILEGVDLGPMEDRLRLWSVFQRLDRLLQLGHYGVLLLGFDGGEPLDQPLGPGPYKLMYLQPHGEETAEISRWEDNPRSPRFGLPVLYRITTGVQWGTGSGNGNRTLVVHHSRVIHVAEDALEHEAIGTPRLEAIWNRLQDKNKLLGGSAEMYWQNVAMIMAFIADAGVKWEPAEAENMRTQIDEMQHGLSRVLRLRGVDVKNIAPGLQGASPGEHVDKQLDMIAGTSGIPKRILIGNEAGEVASTQDENAWAGRVAERRAQFAAPCIVRPFIQRMQLAGVLPPGAFTVEWTETDTMGEMQRADYALKIAQGAAAFVNSAGADSVVTVGEFREALGLDADVPLPPLPELDETDADVQQAFDSQRGNPTRPDENDDAPGAV